MKRVGKCNNYNNAKLPATTPLVSRLARDLDFCILTPENSPPQEKKIVNSRLKDASTQTSSSLLLMAMADVAQKGTFAFFII